MKKILYPTICLCLIWQMGIAQDPHYSQFQNSPLYTNPAFSGKISTKNRLGINYRSQWSPITAPYVTQGIFYDRQLKSGGFGLLINKNDAGDASLHHTNFYLSYALHKRLGSGNNMISLGLQAGFTQKRFDPTAFSFDSQYNTDTGFDPNQTSGETFSKTSALVGDVNLGVLWTFMPVQNRRLSGEIGLAFSHINTPNIGFYEGSEEELPMKRVIHAAFDYRLTNKFTVRPRFLWMSHFTANEFTIGVQGRYRFAANTYLNFGIDVRTEDAFILKAGIDYKNFTIAASYDATTSTLQNPVNGNGGFEIAAIIGFDKLGLSLPKLNDDLAVKAKKKDRDGDGITDDKDECPTVPGIRRLKGCPEQATAQRDSDGDGILDVNDLCPYRPGIAAYQGCNDVDKDGIWDHVDACPTVPGIKELNGCPETKAQRPTGPLDSDGDGILDPNDLCPYKPGTIQYQGCNDIDKDGIWDHVDACPEVYGYRQFQGCPNQKPLVPINDIDKDGIPDDQDLCPYKPGSPQYRGCNDTDKDGIWDHMDVCPQLPGDAVNYGCPPGNLNRDSDKDGVLDKNDKCMYLKGLPQFNGCPDTDGDGISNIDDECPFVKGPAINRGCPATQASNITTALPTREISIDVVEFDTDKSFIRPQYFSMLDRVASIMLQNPTYNIMLVGHTDNEGSDTYNYHLGQRRSKSVRDYLIQRGVTPQRISTMSYGESLPKRQNVSASNKQRNRRTEIVVLEGVLPKLDTRE